ncbi:MAG: Spy/CpxP family protein refolding chaperone [Gammaproteobacteria bacterium]|nr:Spy/CpxP family protein refolding chaperone [Gammaproteobacteria bacterium]
MKRKTVIAAILATATIVALPVISHAGNRGDCERPGHTMHRDGGMGKQGGMMQERGFNRMAKKLDLSDEQKNRIEEILTGNRENSADIREQLMENRKAMRDLDPGAADYDAKVEELAASGSELHKQMTLERASMRKQINEVLNDEQRDKMSSFQEKRGKFRE